MQPTSSNLPSHRGELQCIGATTLDEYRKHIERDAALERRFQPVNVGEPSIDDTIEILQGPEGALRAAPPPEASLTTPWSLLQPLAIATSQIASSPTKRST